MSFASREELVTRAQLVQLYEGIVAQLSANLAQFERIKKVSLLPREFSLDAGELTPTLKVKRRVVEARYKEVIDRMYAGSAAGVSA